MCMEECGMPEGAWNQQGRQSSPAWNAGSRPQHGGSSESPSIIFTVRRHRFLWVGQRSGPRSGNNQSV